MNLLQIKCVSFVSLRDVQMVMALSSLLKLNLFMPVSVLIVNDVSWMGQPCSYCYVVQESEIRDSKEIMR